MTNVVKKGANRAGAAANRSRHAQRTPLPEKGTQPVGRPAAEVGRKMVAERKAARSGKAAKGVAPVGARADTHPKLLEFKADAKPHGWRVSTNYHDESDEMQAVARRGDETIEVMWRGTRFVEAAYMYAGRTIKLRNVSHARQVMAVKPEQVKTPAPRATRKSRDGADLHPTRRRLPWGDNPLDEEVLSAVIGRLVAWESNLTGERQSARISSDPKHLKVEEGAEGRRVLSFTEDGGMFRACYVDSIVAVK